MSRTRRTSTTATEFAHACVERRVHDADLCERIRALEEEVERLKARGHHHYCWSGCNHWIYPQWSWTSGTSTYTGTTTGTLKTGTVITYDQ